MLGTHYEQRTVLTELRDEEKKKKKCGTGFGFLRLPCERFVKDNSYVLGLEPVG